jgi:hypothetical protein
MQGFKPIALPAATTVVSAQLIANGPPVSPTGRIKLYSPEEWETFTNEWAFYFFQGKTTERFTGVVFELQDFLKFLAADRHWPSKALPPGTEFLDAETGG